MKIVVTLPPLLEGADALAFAHRARARGASLLELRTDLHGDLHGDLHDGGPAAGDARLDVAGLARALPLLVAERGSVIPETWKSWAQLVDVDIARGDAAAASLASLHADRPLAPAEALARWRAAPLRPGVQVKHVEPLGEPREFRRLLETRALLEERFGRGHVTVLAMGSCALPFRALLAEGNALDYVALEPRWQAAPGQRLLDDAVRARRQGPGARATTMRLGILGSRIAHSRSPRVHEQPFDRIDLPEDAPLEQLLPALLPHYRGFAVTSPFKKSCAALSKSPLPAVNTLVRATTGYEGHNTDIAGARAVLDALAARQVTVLGDGGATAALRLAARQAEVALHVVTSAALAGLGGPLTGPLTGSVVWTWPAHREPPAALRFEGARVAIIQYGPPALDVEREVVRRGGTPLRLGARWFIAQARAQRELWRGAA